MNKYTFLAVLAALCFALSFYYQDTLKEIGYIVMMCFWVLMIGVEKIRDGISQIKEKLDNEQ